MLVEHYHFDCHCVPYKRTCSQVREFYCEDHAVVVGPSGYEIGHVPLGNKDAQYTTNGSWLFLCSLIKSMTDKIEFNRKKWTERQASYDRYVVKRGLEIRHMRRDLARDGWKPIQMYADISGNDYEVIAEKIIKINT